MSLMKAYVLTAPSAAGTPLYWKKHLMSSVQPCWVPKFSIECIYHSVNTILKLMNGNGSKYFMPINGMKIMEVEICDKGVIVPLGNGKYIPVKNETKT